MNIDKASFPDTFYVENGWAYGDFSLDRRLALKQGKQMSTQIGSTTLSTSLTGSTAALLKVQECWQKMSGWTKRSSRAGTFAFSGD